MTLGSELHWNQKFKVGKGLIDYLIQPTYFYKKKKGPQEEK